MVRTFSSLLLLIAITASIEAQAPALDLEINFEGNRVFSSEALSRALDACHSKYIDQKVSIDSRLRDYCLQTYVLNHLRSEGYLEAKISAPKKREKQLIIEIEEGLRYRLGGVNITGSSIFTTRQLLEGLDLKTGHIANGPQLQQWAYEHIKDLYDDIGHFQSISVFEAVFRRDPANPFEGIVDINLEIDEGRRFKIRRIEFVGNGVGPDPVLRRTMLIKEGEIFRRKKLVESIKNLNDMGLYDLIDHDQDVEFLTDAESPTLDIRIRLRKRRY